MKTYKILMVGSALMAFTFTNATANAFNDVTSLNSPTTQQHPKFITVSENREQQAKDFIESLTNEGIAFLSNSSLTDGQRKAAFKKLLNKNFDMHTLGRFSLGRYWNVASKSEKSEYQKLFEKNIIDVYSRRFSDYQGQELIVKSARSDGKSDAIVSSFMNHKGQKVSVDWRVRQKKGTMKVIDVIVEGVSMATTQRSEFSSIIQRGGGQVDALITHLKS